MLKVARLPVWVQWFCAAVAAGLAARPTVAQVGPGDVAVVAYNADRDDFAWVALRTIPAGTVLCFTDASVSNGAFRWTEHLGDLWPGPLTWSCSSNLPAGTVVRWSVTGATNWSVGQHSGGRPRLSADGDQLFIYTGTIVSNAALSFPWCGDPAAARLLFGINFANDGWDNRAGGEPTTSFVPPGLAVENGTAVHVDRRDNGWYNGPLRGTPAELLRAIANPAHWITADEPFDQSVWPTALLVLSEGTWWGLW